MMGWVVGLESEVVEAEVGIEVVEEDVGGLADIGDEEEEDECRELIEKQSFRRSQEFIRLFTTISGR